MKKLDTKYNLDKVIDEIRWLEKNETWVGEQYCLQDAEGESHGCGNADFLDFEEKDFINLKTPDDWEISRFIKDHDLVRTRIMNLQSKTCYSIHRDRTKRVHLPVITNKNCKLIINDIVHHLPADGYAWLVDTTQMHTAMNANLDFNRYHIVGCLNE